MNDSLKMDIFFQVNYCQSPLLIIMIVVFILKCVPKRILPNAQNVVMKPQLIMEPIYVRCRIFRFLGNQHDFI